MSTEHFSDDEFACRCGCGLMGVDFELENGLELLRAKLGHVPIVVLSGLRCRRHNRRVGGTAKSRHVMGTAADIKVKGFNMAEIYRQAQQIEKFNHGGIGLYPQEGFVHVDVRRHRARWSRVDGHYTSIGAGLD